MNRRYITYRDLGFRAYAYHPNCDVGVFLGFSFGKNPQRAFVSTALVLGLLNGVIPGVIGEMGWTWLEAVVFRWGLAA